MDKETIPASSKRVLEIIRLVVPLIGLICLILFLIFYFGFAEFEHWPQDPDRIRRENIREIRMAMVVYYADNNSQYLQSITMPTSIGEIIPEVPKDPNGESYGWIDNTSDSQKFCVWAKIEEKDAYFVASPLWQGEIKHLPADLNECYEPSNLK